MALTLSWVVIEDIKGLYMEWKCKNERESVRVCEQIREMCICRDRGHMTLFNKEGCNTIIDFLCTG